MSDFEKARIREVAQILIAEIGASGPMDAEEAAEKVVRTIRDLRQRRAGALKMVAYYERALQYIRDQDDWRGGALRAYCQDVLDSVSEDRRIYAA